MRLFNPLIPWTSLLLLGSVAHQVKADYIGANSLKPCMENSGITATWVDIALHPNTSQIAFDIEGYSSISDSVLIKLSAVAYGFEVFSENFNPCQKAGWTQFCPMKPSKISISSNENVGKDLVSQIPKIAYQAPDLDGHVRIEILSATSNGKLLACVDAQLSNGVTLETTGVSWSTAIIGGGATLFAIVIIACSDPNLSYYHMATAKFATYSLTFFTFLQTQALIGMTSVPLRPIVAAWTQNFMWSVGIVQLKSTQKFFRWYIKSTGGTVSQLFQEAYYTSILVTKRDVIPNALRRFVKRDDTSARENITVKGIERVAYKAGIEQTNLFVTAYGTYIIFVVAIAIAFVAFRFLVEELAKRKKMGMENKFVTIRTHWQDILRKIVLSLVVTGFPAMVTLSLWELTRKDSPAAMALAVIMFLVMMGLMSVTVFRLYMLLRRKGVMPFASKSPLGKFAGGSNSDGEKQVPFSEMGRSSPEMKVAASRGLKEFAILTLPYRRSGVYWLLPLFIFVFIKSALVGLSQQHLYKVPDVDSKVGTAKGTAQAIGFLVTDFLWLVAVAWVRPWMDKRTNSLGISVAAVGLINSICLCIFTGIFGGNKEVAAAIVGVLFVIMNVIMAIILLVVTVVGAFYGFMDWKKGHPNSQSHSTDPTVADNPPPSPPASPSPTGTPAPFLPATKTDEPNTETVHDPIEHLGYPNPFSDDTGRNSMMTTESRDITGMQPTEPNMSISNFNAHTGGSGMVYTTTDPDAIGYPLVESPTFHSQQTPAPVEPLGSPLIPMQTHNSQSVGSPLIPMQTHNSQSIGQQHALGLSGSGIVGIGAVRSEDGRSTYADSYRSGSRDDHYPPNGSLPSQFQQQQLPPYPPQPRRQDSHLSQRSVGSNNSQTMQVMPVPPAMYAPARGEGGFAPDSQQQRTPSPQIQNSPLQQQHTPPPQTQYSPPQQFPPQVQQPSVNHGPSEPGAAY